MLSFRIYRRIRPLKRDWEQLIPEDARSIYQTYSFNEIVFRHYIRSGRNLVDRIRFGSKPVYAVAYEDGKAVCIAPLYLINNPAKVIRILGYSTNAGYLDFIYRDRKYAAALVRELRKRYPEHDLEFTFIPADSPLCREGEAVKEYGNYAVRLPDYDAWWTDLSKSTKQNIRTAYNRLRTDGHTFRLALYDMNSPGLEEVIRSANDLYWRRRVDWTGNEKEYSKYNREKFPVKDVIYQSLRKKENTIMAVLKVDNRDAGFFVGLRYRHGICIPRLAIDMEFARYSPGIILINEYLKSLPEDEFPYTFDLCRGEEGYKTSLRGERTSTYKIRSPHAGAKQNGAADRSGASDQDGIL